MSWPMVKLGDVLSIIRGVTFKPNDQVEPLSEGSTIVMRTKNVQRSGLDISDLIAIPDSFIKRDEQYLRSEDMLISSANSWELVGKISFVEKLPARSTAGGFISIIRAKKEKVIPKFLYYWLTSEQTQVTIRNCGQKTTNISNLNLERFKELLIPLPPLNDQRRIVTILDKAAGICQKREQAINQSDNFLRATFLEMFPQLDDRRNKVKLGDIVTLDALMVDPREDKFIDLIHIGPDRIERNTGLLLPALTAREENLISKKFLFDESYVLYSKIRPYLKKCAIPDFGGLCSADMYPVKPITGKTNREFIWQLLLSDFFTKYTETLPNRANIPKLNRKELLSFELSLPPVPLQEKYKAIVQKTNHAKLIMRTQNGNSILNKLADELFLTN